ncbi:hypothetical protein M5K25_013088 [Dendrobium thyrsiflorum]|uniref:Uncharacterized protein n=1 Tax=Dendrobium thyrsiflorum TaxID=117978 RepID=A0ABD0V5U9_DENTH
MGKNQAYKAMQRSRLSDAAGPEEFEDGRVDGTFHSPEWHAARLASLNTSHTITWEEFKKKQKKFRHRSDFCSKLERESLFDTVIWKHSNSRQTFVAEFRFWCSAEFPVEERNSTIQRGESELVYQRRKSRSVDLEMSILQGGK